MPFDWNKLLRRQAGKLAVRMVLGMATGGVSEAEFLGADLIDVAVTTGELLEAVAEVREAADDVVGLTQAAVEDSVLTVEEARSIYVAGADPVK